MSVRLTGFDDELMMLVDVQGASGLDVTVVSDRVDAAGGTLSIDETDDATALTARLPTSDSTAMASSPSGLVSEPS